MAGAYGLTHTGRRLVSIRTLLMSGVERCPICGISAPQTLDHHLPKSTYHPLSVYVRNLAPLCKDCNEFKNAAAPADVAQRFIHPYFEWIPEQRFLRAEVTIAEGGLVAAFSLDPLVEMPALLATRLNYQLGKLRLNARYAQEINTYLSGHTTAFHWCF